MGGWSYGEIVESVGLAYSLVGSWTLAGGLDDMLAAVTWLFAAFTVHCVTCGIELANSFQLCIANENLWEVYNTHSVPSL